MQAIQAMAVRRWSVLKLASNQNQRKQGFSLVEIMVAMVILSMSVMTIVSLQRASVRGAVNARYLTVASMLARSIMVDAYLENYKKEIANSMDEEKSGEEEMAGLSMKWTWALRDVPLQIPTKFAEEEEGEETEEGEGGSASIAQNQLLVPIIKSLNEVLAKAMKELSVTVSWESSYGEEEIYLVTHLIDFSYRLPIPELGGASKP